MLPNTISQSSEMLRRDPGLCRKDNRSGESLPECTGQNSHIRQMEHPVQSWSLSLTGPQKKKPSIKHFCNVKIETENLFPSTSFLRCLKYFQEF